MRFKRAWLFLVLSLILPFVSATTLSAAQPYRLLGIGARPLGMGGAFIAVVDDANATYWNPAGLPQLHSREIISNNLFSNRDVLWHHDQFSFIQPAQGLGTAGISYIRSGFEEVTIGGTSIQKWTDHWFFFSYGYAFNEMVSLGGNLGIHSSEVAPTGGNTAYDSAFQLDLGGLISPHKIITLGILVQSVNGVTLFEGQPYQYKNYTKVRPSIMFRPDKKTILAAQVEESRGLDGEGNKKIEGNFGVERWLTKSLALRAGYHHDNWTAGLGLRQTKYPINFRLDYAYVQVKDVEYGPNESNHLVSISMVF